MARIPKDLLSTSEAKALMEQSLIHDKNSNYYGVRDKDLEPVLDLIKNKSINEGVTTKEADDRTYSLRVITMVISMIKKSSGLSDHIAILGVINSLYLISPQEASRLLNLLKSNMEW